MKFLVMAKPRAGAPLSSAALQGQKEVINRYLKSGANDCVYLFPDGGGFGIANADSGEHLMQMLTEIPTYPFLDWEVRPLSEFTQGMDRMIQLFKSLGM
jgi:muconolactone delta-isomerase